MQLMKAVLIAAIIAVLASMGMVVARGILGRTLYDRLLAVNSFGTTTVLLIALLAFVSGQMAYLDVALTYALINFISTIAALKYFKFKSLGKR